jgi:hypothetical protein
MAEVIFLSCVCRSFVSFLFPFVFLSPGFCLSSTITDSRGGGGRSWGSVPTAHLFILLTEPQRPGPKYRQRSQLSRAFGWTFKSTRAAKLVKSLHPREPLGLTKLLRCRVPGNADCHAASCLPLLPGTHEASRDSFWFPPSGVVA